MPNALQNLNKKGSGCNLGKLDISLGQHDASLLNGIGNLKIVREKIPKTS